MFKVVIQFASILAVVVIYFHKLNPFSPKKTASEKKDTYTLWSKVIVAVIPAAVIGFLFEDLIKIEKAKELLKYIDVLVDGKFEIENKSLSIKFRGSTNQRIINVPKSLKNEKVHQIKKYDKKEIKPQKRILYVW